MKACDMPHSFLKLNDQAFVWKTRLALTNVEAADAIHLVENLPVFDRQNAPNVMLNRVIDYAASEPELASLLFAYLISQGLSNSVVEDINSCRT